MKRLFNNIKEMLRELINSGNDVFNRLPNGKKRGVILLFGFSASIVSGSLIRHAIYDRGNLSDLKFKQIEIPYDIFMNDTTRVSETRLTPVGKMKGEIEGEFESFYVAVDHNGSIFINRDIEYTESAYDKTDAWQQISREKLIEYGKDLHFIPSQSKGVRR